MSPPLLRGSSWCCFFFALRCPGVWSWVTISQSRFGAQLEAIRALQKQPVDGQADPYADVHIQQTLGYLWSQPSDPSSHRGLGGGITWAWDPNLCDALLPTFKEDFFFVPFVTCPSLKSAMHRAFASWSDNSAALSFNDVTAECEKLSQTGRAEQDCPLAELWVTFIGHEASPGDLSGQADRLTTASSLSVEVTESLSDGSLPAAMAEPDATASAHFRYTNGATPTRRQVVETVSGTLSFNTDLCWYLDSTFCYQFHSVKGLVSDKLTPSQILLVARLVRS